MHERISRRPDLAILLAMLLAVVGLTPSSVAAQETRERDPDADRVPGAAEPGAAAADSARAAALAAADSIRAALAARRPPNDHPTDLADVVAVPFKLVAVPAHFVLVHVPSFLLGEITAPRPPGFLVRALRDLGEAGIRPGLSSSIGPRSGPAATLRLEPPGPVGLEGAFSVRGFQRYRAGARLGGDRSSFVAGAGWRRDAQVAFYGIGPDADDLRTVYRHERFDVAAGGQVRLAPVLLVRGGAAYENNRIAEPVWEGDEPSTFEEFDPAGLFGATRRLEFVRFGAGGVLDFTRRVGFQDRGVLLAADAVRYEAADDAASGFHKLRFDARGGIPLNPRQLLFLRGLTELTRGVTGRVPFYHLSTLGGEQTALGYPETRFRDLDMVSLTAEWRYEVWRDIHNSIRLESFLYVGEGAVAPRLHELAAQDWRASYGAGLRVARLEELLGTFYIGFSEESFHLGVSGEVSP